MQQEIILTTDVIKDLSAYLRKQRYDGLYILTDTQTEIHCFPLIREIPEVKTASRFTIPSGDENKTLTSLEGVWKFLSDQEASRKSLLINLGGGMLTDLGGFAAATFKRGIRFINISTTLLGAVDAAVGGKTGINFNGLKNEIGSFAPASAVFIDSGFFRTLDQTNILSGFAEMLKHGLLSSREDLDELLRFNLDDINYLELNDLIYKSIRVKERIVEEDPQEQGIRKALNLGHTFGHAFESLSHELQKPIPHGYAVAWGIVCELFLSLIQFGFDKNSLMQIAAFVKSHYGKYSFDCKHYPRLYELMQHDKKNEFASINFTLLKAVGDIRINQTANQSEIEECLDFLREY